MINKWDINEKLFLILHDSAANMICAMRNRYESLGCVAHTLQRKSHYNLPKNSGTF